MQYHLSLVSRNTKTGAMPVATITKETCPDACPLKNGGGCYAETGPLALHWNAVSRSERGMNFEQFIQAVRNLNANVWRYAQAGDLPGKGNEIDKDQLLKLAKANHGREVIAFTHKPPNAANLEALIQADAMGFHVNLSANGPHEVDDLADTGMSVVTLLPFAYGRNKKETLSEYRERLRELPTHTPAGRRIAVCPATYTETSCLDCRACARKRKSGAVIGFPAHGARASKVDAGLEQGASRLAEVQRRRRTGSIPGEGTQLGT